MSVEYAGAPAGFLPDDISNVGIVGSVPKVRKLTDKKLSGVGTGRGGMCAEMTGAPRADGTRRERLDRMDFAQLRRSNDSPDRMLLLQVIADAISEYLYFGLGKNGTTADEFAWSCNYLFKVRWSKPETWLPYRSMRETAENEHGGRTTRVIQLTDQQLRMMCFDEQYRLCEFYPTFDTFLEKLEQERREILLDNWSRVQKYIGKLAATNMTSFPELDKILPHRSDRRDLIDILTRPQNERELAEVLFSKDWLGLHPDEVVPASNTSHVEDGWSALLALAPITAPPVGDLGSFGAPA